MIERSVRIRPLTDPTVARDDAAFWREQPPAARLPKRPKGEGFRDVLIPEIIIREGFRDVRMPSRSVRDPFPASRKTSRTDRDPFRASGKPSRSVRDRFRTCRKDKRTARFGYGGGAGAAAGFGSSFVLSRAARTSGAVSRGRAARRR